MKGYVDSFKAKYTKDNISYEDNVIITTKDGKFTFMSKISTDLGIEPGLYDTVKDLEVGYFNLLKEQGCTNIVCNYMECLLKRMKSILETKVTDNIFENKVNITFDNLSGGISLGLDEDTISISVSLNEEGSGSYKLASGDTLEVFKKFKNDVKELCTTFDNGLEELLQRYGLKSTK